MPIPTAPPPPFEEPDELLLLLTLTITLSAVWPPAPVQVSVKVVFAVIAGLVAVSLAACVPVKLPDQPPPEATQVVAPVVVQIRWTVPPEVTLVASADRLTVGAAGAGLTLSA